MNWTNPQKRIPGPQLDSLHQIQRGIVGDLTASRKVRVFDVPLEQALELICLAASVYSVKLFIEGIGLWLEKTWAPTCGRRSIRQRFFPAVPMPVRR